MPTPTIRAAALFLIWWLTGAASAPAERVVVGGGIVAVTIDGAAGRLRVDPAATAMPLIDAAFAQRAGLKGGAFALRYTVGPEHVDGHSAVAALVIDGVAVKRRIGWTPRRYAADVDGVIGPGGLPENVVRFVLRPALAGERTAVMPLVDQGGLMAGWGERFATVMVGGQPMRVRFDPHHRRTLATAGAAVRLAAALGGRIEGAVSSEEIAFGNVRPVRTLRLGTPLRVGPLSIATLGVRTGDGGSTVAIADAQAADAADPDEVVVTARRRHDGSRDRIALGDDVLARCSSIVFDKPARAIRLTCG